MHPRGSGLVQTLRRAATHILDCVVLVQSREYLVLAELQRHLKGARGVHVAGNDWHASPRACTTSAPGCSVEETRAHPRSGMKRRSWHSRPEFTILKVRCSCTSLWRAEASAGVWLLGTTTPSRRPGRTCGT